MKVRDCLIPTIVTLASCYAGFKVCGERVSPYRPVDSSGRTSIVVEIDGIGWCELRGPARWKVLEDCTGPPIVEAEAIVPSGPACEGCIDNPYYTGSAE